MGLIAGFFHAYACSVMTGLARVDDRTFIDVMQGINATVRNQWFAPSFLGALLLTALAVLLHLGRDARAVLAWAAAALVLYGAAFSVTMGVHVPLNEDLAAAGDPAALGDPAAVRAAFEDRRWPGTPCAPSPRPRLWPACCGPWRCTAGPHRVAARSPRHHGTPSWRGEPVAAGPAASGVCRRPRSPC